MLLISLQPSNSQKEFLEQATQQYEADLRSGEAEDARSYLKTARGLSGGNAQFFRLGLVVNPLPGHESYRGALAVPYQTRSGIVSMRFRRLPARNPRYGVDPLSETVTTVHLPDLDEALEEPEWLPLDGPKYLSTPGDHPWPFNPADLSRSESFVCICEGEIDCMTAHQDGLPAVGIAGVNAWRSDFAKLFIGYKAVYILADHDDKGQGNAFAQKVASQIGNSRVVLLPEGHDVNSFYVANGSSSIRNLIEEKQ
jgi:DNA primase